MRTFREERALEVRLWADGSVCQAVTVHVGTDGARARRRGRALVFRVRTRQGESGADEEAESERGEGGERSDGFHGFSEVFFYFWRFIYSLLVALVISLTVTAFPPLVVARVGGMTKSPVVNKFTLFL